MATTDGEYGAITDATEDTEAVCDLVKKTVEEKTGKKYVEFKAVKYRQKDVVGGTNYLIKVHVGGDDYIYLTVFEDIGEEVFLHDVQDHQTIDSPLVPF
ncbi:hypothetical protein PFLUV_G00093460 [Perca fluviatilis]|uniref:Cystatin-B n=1 Tax=Perca fluviatilis TaxID=8168 RepID=A0A6A5EB76_PERFL|nr:cystatin-B-like [Perca fluviatilis]KAF1386321.1 hypothetical protein PFLUV_G00093460 [Perca fluviatilis]